MSAAAPAQEVGPDDPFRALVRAYFIRVGQTNIEANLDQVLSPANFLDRFNYFMPRLPGATLRRMLVSGCSVGTEIALAREKGFAQVSGTEVKAALVELT